MTLLLAAATASAQEVRVTARAGDTGAVVCMLRSATGVPAPERLTATSGQWVWRPASGDVVSCSSPGFEPVSLEAGPTPPPPEIGLELLPSRAVTLLADWMGVDTLIEWRAIGTPTTTLLARQPVKMGNRVTIPVATQHRVIRLRPAGSSPLSLFVPEGTSEVVFRLPRPEAGGEIFGALTPYAYVPEALEMRGRTTRTLKPDSLRVFRASGVAAGRYTLVPRYRGGVVGRAQEVTILPGQTSELLPLSLPEPGAVSLVTPQEMCSREQLPARLSLRRLEEEGVLLLEQIVKEPPCERELEGLEEGTYEAALVRSGGGSETLASVMFGTQRGRRLRVELVPIARVAGRVTFGDDRPAPGLTLVFDFEGRSWTTETDSNGDYAAVLGPPGEYAVSVRASKDLPSVSFSRPLHPGEQREDFKLNEAGIGVHVIRQDGGSVDEVVQVVLTSKSGRRVTGSCSPQEEKTVRFVGLDFDEYWVTGSTSSGLKSQVAARVELSPQEPAAEVNLVLGRHKGLIEVLDESGAPLDTALVLAGEQPLMAQAPGVFPLTDVPVGERLRVRADGHAPVCHVFQEQDLPELRVALPKATESLTIHFPPHLPWETGLLVGLPGSDCPVEVGELEPATRMEANRTTLVLKVPAGRFQFLIGATSRVVAVPGNAISIVGSEAQASTQPPPDDAEPEVP